jgi:MYXO-CTERM domain-containing protein
MLRTGLFAAVSCLAFASAAAADPPRGGYIRIDPSMADIRIIDDTHPAPTAHGSHTLYINPCWGGETFSPGYNDSRTNRSSIISGSRNLPQYPYGEASYNQVVACVREIMAPFNLEVVSTDPGNTPHHEAVLCGHPNDLGMGGGVGGVAPFSCGVIENAITYTFPEVYGGHVRGMCETIAQEAAHGWGLDHEYLCEDPMTYLGGCGNKSYQDVDARCGEGSPRNCECGGATQNSFRRILATFGSATPTPPSVTITEPLPNAQVEAGFVVQVDLQDDQGIDVASLFVDGDLVQTVATSPFVFNGPADLADGTHTVEVRATDIYGAEGSDEIYVIVGEPCGGNDDCADGEACVDGRCVPGPGTDGGLGEPCQSGADCASGLCGTASDGTKACTEPCDPAADGCPGGFECRTAGEGGVCWASDGDGGVGGVCGCALGAEQSPAGILLLVAGVGLILRRRRREGRGTSAR